MLPFDDVGDDNDQDQRIDEWVDSLSALVSHDVDALAYTSKPRSLSREEIEAYEQELRARDERQQGTNDLPGRDVPGSD